MLRFVFLLLATMSLAAATAGTIQADVIYVEDFEEYGEPGFDPMFSHEIGQSPYSTSSAQWELCDATDFPEHGAILALYIAQDTVSFLLNPGQEIIYASIEVQSWGRDIYQPEKYSVDFIGRDGTLRAIQTEPLEWEKIEVSSRTIGPILSIVMRSGEGYFDNITIHVVPEPTVTIGLIGFAICMTYMAIKAMHA